MKTNNNLGRRLIAFVLMLYPTLVFAAGPGSVAEGAELYNLNCVRCHNARPAEDYTARQWSVVMPHMREKAHLTRQETLLVETFLASTLTADKLPEGLAESSLEYSGEALVNQFGCQGCHRLGSIGGTVGPSLVSVVALKGVDYVMKKLADPTFDNRASAMPRYPMNDEQLRVITSYLGSLGTGIAQASPDTNTKSSRSEGLN